MARPWTRFSPADAIGPYPPGTLTDLVRHAPPDKLALIDGDERHSYKSVRTAISSAAAALHARGVRPGDRALVRLPNSLDFIATIHGAFELGAIAVPVSPLAGAGEFERIVEDCDPRVIVESPLPACPALPRTPTPDPDLSAIARLVRNSPQGDGGRATPDPAVVAVLQYTSGTTGTPKGARMTHQNLIANALQNARWFGWTGDEINLCVLPLFHTWGLCVCLHSTFALGGTLVLASRFDPVETLRLVVRHEATVLYGSATMFHRLLDVPRADMPTLRHVKAGAMLSQGNLKARWDERYPHAPLQQGYGLTEASPESHNNPPARFKTGTVGIPLPDTDCRITDPDDPAHELEPGERGEVCLKGPQVCDGYWNDADTTAAAFFDGWLRTGDLGVMDEEGYLTIVGRQKDMLKFRGYTVAPNAVEECLLEHDGVREAAVVGRPHQTDGDVPVAFVVASPDSDSDPSTAKSLRDHCRAALAPHEVPREFVLIDEIPKNAVGKPLRRKLRELLQDR